MEQPGRGSVGNREEVLRPLSKPPELEALAAGLKHRGIEMESVEKWGRPRETSRGRKVTGVVGGCRVAGWHSSGDGGPDTCGDGANFVFTALCSLALSPRDSPRHTPRTMGWPAALQSSMYACTVARSFSSPDRDESVFDLKQRKSSITCHSTSYAYSEVENNIVNVSGQ